MLSKTAATILLATLIGCSSEKSDTADDTEATEETGGDQDPATDTAEEETGPEIWTGPSMTFTKEDGADHTDPANQDAITDLVVLTRANRGSLINIAVEDAATASTPSGTEWAEGSTDNMEGLAFNTLKGAANNNMSSISGKSYVLHLVEEDIFIDVTFLSWTAGGNGGGFSYERSTQE